MKSPQSSMCYVFTSFLREIKTCTFSFQDNQNSIEEAFMPTLKTLFSAPVTSPLNEVDSEDVGLFMIQLTDRGFLQSNGSENPESSENCHDSMAYAICNQIIAEPMNFHVKILLKLLTSLQISVDEYSKLKELKALQSQMMDQVTDFTKFFVLFVKHFNGAILTPCW